MNDRSASILDVLETLVRAIRDAEGRAVGAVGVNREVTDQRAAVKELEALFGALTDPVFVIDRDGRYCSVAPGGSELLFAPSQELNRRTIRDVLPAEVAGRLERAVVTALDEGRTTAIEYSLEIEGERHHFLASLSPMDEDRVVWIARDITGRHRFEERLRSSKEQLQSFLDAIPDHCWMKDRGGRYQLANEAYLRAWNRSREEIVGRTDAELFPPETAEEFVATDRQVIESRRRLVFEHHLRDESGNVRWYEVIKAPLFGRDGEASATVGISREITRRKATEAALRETEARFSQLAETIPQAFWIVDPTEGNVLYVSPAFEEIWERELPIGREGVRLWIETVHPHDRDEVALRYRSSETVGEPYELTYRIVRPDGEVRWIHDRGFPVADAEGRVYRFAGVAEDISEQREVEREMKRQALLFQATNEAVFYTDLGGRITEWNPAAEKIFGYPRDEAIGRRIEDLGILGEETEDGDKGYFEAFRRREIWTGERTTRCKDGSRAICEVTMLPVYQAGQFEGAISIARDITDRRSLEEQLRQSQKLEGIGRLAGGIAHDFNNMLLAIQGFATLLKQEIPPRGVAADYLAEILDAADRSSRLTRQLLAYSRRQIMRTEIIDLNEVARRLESMLRRMIGEDVSLTTDLDPGLWPVAADPSQIEQVIINLAVNARDAMPEGGALIVGTRPHDVDAEPGDYPVTVPAGSYTEIFVRDSGVGMDEDVLSMAFEPFFTTKGVGEGTGLGLSTVYGIVKQSGGHVWAESAPGEGTVVRVLLPVAKRTKTGGEEAMEPAEELAPSASGATVLVVEDEPAVRRLITLVLERGGYRVIATSTAEETRRALETHREPLAVALIDVVLRGESGRVVAQHLRTQRPETKIVFMSGYTDDQLIRHGIGESGHRFLQKPIPPEVLLQTVREVLE